MTRKIAIVGAGPSGCYTAQALLKAAPDLEVDVLDRMPLPYGLVRYGVAADHQGTKAVTRQFARLFERQGARFIGNVKLGDAPEQVSLAQLRDAYDGVVLALGLHRDHRAGLPGEDLHGVIGSGELTRHWNDHPDAADTLPDFGPGVVVLGNGNVAMDVVRMLAKRPEDFDNSDLANVHADRIARAGISRIEVVGRSPAHMAKFDPVMVKELAKLPHVAVEVHDLDLSAEQEDDARIVALTELPQGDAPVTVAFRFGQTPIRVEGETRVTGLTVSRDDHTQTIACDSLVTAIGFETAGTARAALLAEAEDPELGVVTPGLYLAGWYARGPRGTIPDNRQAGQALATRILSDLETLPKTKRAGSAALSHLETTDYDGWRRIDARERADCPPGRVRSKINRTDEMLEVARDTTETLK